MVAVVCYAPWNNSSEWVNTSRRFEARDVKPPKMNKSNLNSKGKHSKFVYFIGDKTRSIFCNSSGEPKPKIQWILPPKLESKFRHVGIDENKETLYMPLLDDTLRGSWKFTCTATNDYGKASQDFWVDVVEPEKEMSDGAIVAIILSCIIILALLVGLSFILRKFSNAKKQLRNFTLEEIQEMRQGNHELLAANGTNVSANERIRWLAFDPAFEIPEADLIIAKNSLLGEGQYGKVYRGFLRDEAVAVKTTKSGACISYVKALLSELKIMAYIGDHPNVVRFRGAVLARLHERIVHVVMEVSPLGNLKQFLRQLGTDFLNLVTADGKIDACSKGAETAHKTNTLHLIYFCKQITSAMEFLVLKQVIHGDLATRNILLFKNNVVKITDFGLSRQLYGYEKYVRKHKIPVPWQWMALESLRYQEFSSKSDVWSFGVTAWEIFTLAQVPFPGLRWTSAFMDNLASGTRLAKPEFGTELIYSKLLDCWKLEPSDRPSFSQLLSFFSELLQEYPNEFPCKSDYEFKCGENSVG